MTKEFTQAALCAKEIRKILKQEFSGIKFRVTSSNFSMGNSVRVNWIDGPTKEQVEKKIGHFQYGHFDGMQDLYEHSNCREDIPQTKFLQCERELSQEVVREFAKKYNKEWGLNEPTEDLGYSFEHNNEYSNWYQRAWKELYEVELQGGKN